MVRKISVICDKLNDALLERRRKKLTDLREGKQWTETSENSSVRDWDVREDNMSEGERAEGAPSVQEIEDVISDISINLP